MLLDNTPAIAALSEAGFKPLPVKPGEKHPYVAWTKYKTASPWPLLKTEFKPGISVWSPMGTVTGWVCLDCDNEEAHVLWRERLGDLLDRTAAVKTRKGTHFYFKIERDDPWAGWVWRSDPEAEQRGALFEVLADGQGVMLPPSQHADDRSFTYKWIRDPSYALPAPELLRAPSRKSGTVTSTAARLLDKLPEEGGRDVWMAQVGGHLARWIPYEDAFLSLMHVINHALDNPLDNGEVDKKIGIWHKERTKAIHQYEPDAGWLVGTGTTIMSESKEKIDGGGWRYSPYEWADFDLRVRGVVDDGRQRVYVVDFHHKSGRTREALRVAPSLFGRSADLTTWLAAQGGSIMQPENDAHRAAEGRRLLRYLDAQDAPAYRTVDHLGWHADLGGFVVHEGIATADGIAPHDEACPDPKLADWAPYRYGTVVTSEQAVQVLREVLTFQDETVTSVFGAWWVMALLKGQYATSLFPFLALEAPSESGKTTGFFAMMVALAGNAQGHGQQTAAAVRDAVAGHRNGLVWLDDLTDVGDVVDLIRQATSEGSRSKKGGDRISTETVRLLSPILVSGEGLGSVMREKAMVDRAVRLSVPSPVGRRSASNPSRPQWDDVLALYAQYENDLTGVAGSLLTAILASATPLAELDDLRASSARRDDKLAILRCGARVLAKLTGDHFHIDRVDAWCADTVDEGAMNLAVREIIPWALRANQMPHSARGRQPAFVDGDGIVWVHTATLADAWLDRRNLSARQRQLGEEGAIKSELHALSVPTGKNCDASALGDGRRSVWRYRPLSESLSRYVVGIATGNELDDLEDRPD